jgi:hypothetical protein
VLIALEANIGDAIVTKAAPLHVDITVLAHFDNGHSVSPIVLNLSSTLFNDLSPGIGLLEIVHIQML